MFERHRQVTQAVTTYVGGSMEHGLLYYSNKRVPGRIQREPGMYLDQYSSSTVVVAHATCLRFLACTHHTHAYVMSTQA